ncbi:alpha/beta fold hydrolase [Zhihengliuella halotolerans]|uniref:Dipeptidyl aminopeptidase/acylaminoacyl peptidase n=1 Tax=Zhihengliuella halotolerans TaxID=370736 RepID=A0A4Q8AF65_9MICC|nr:alpha/beta fold hydrolase [Zhihengliuella halotolerans]RZU62940.1 dipeptidyl aminopeptidase/acylaminoacyl peptidase [Zhihengliuella halotolerans]
MCHVTHTKHSFQNSPFHDLDAFIALPRLSGLALNDDGTRLVSSLSTLNEERTAYVSALWEIDPTGERPARQVSRGADAGKGAKGESAPAFTAAGDLLFTAARPGTENEDKPALWSLPAGGGEARLLAEHPGGIAAARTTGTDVVVLKADATRRAGDLAAEAEVQKGRKDKKVAAILHDGYPVRFWDHDLGPATPRYYALALNSDGAAGEPLREVGTDTHGRLTETGYDVAHDGTFLVTDWHTPEGRGSIRTDLVRIDVATGATTVLRAADDEHEYSVQAISPAGSHVVFTRWVRSTPELPSRQELRVLDLESGEDQQIAAVWDRYPTSVKWLPDASGLLITADEDGRSPVFHLDLATDAVTRLTEEGAFTDVTIARDGTAAYALRSSYEFPAEPVRLDLTQLAEGVAPLTALRGPAERPQLPGTLTEIETMADDGTRVRAWLALPEGASDQSPAPLLLWIHGGPVASWNAWSWRWTPWILVAAGYAVLLPDPALSTGYGQSFIDRGWGAWGDAPYTDLMAITDAAEVRDDIDETRTAAMGGSFGGYMANWVAGHTDRFKAIVTHASLWALDGFGPTTDASFFWAREMSEEMQEAHSPHRYVSEIRTPMLVIHGDKDYRVPIGEGLRLWYELLSKSGLPQEADGTTAHRFLYFPDENHWILTPQHAKIWYQVNLGFLAERVLEKGPQELPELLG